MNFKPHKQPATRPHHHHRPFSTNYSLPFMFMPHLVALYGQLRTAQLND